MGAELEYGLRAGASYSDNVDRVPDNEQSSGAGILGLDLRGTRETGRLRYDVYGDLEYRDYFEKDIDSQEFGRLIAQTSYAFVPDAFDWLLSGSFDQVREDLLRPVAPDNLENVITFSTGPRATARFGDTVEAQGEAHYTVANYSERDFDSNTAGGSVTLGRRMSERSYIGLGASYDDVTYDVARGVIAPDYERYEYFLRFNTEGARTTFEADAGYTQIKGVGIEDDGPMARARLTRRLTPYVSGFLAYTREFPTSSDASFTPTPEQGDVVGDSSVLTPAPRENESAEIGLTMTRPRTSALLAFARRSEATVGLGGESRDYDEINASFSRLITTRSSFGLYAIHTKEKLDDVIVDPLAPPVDADAKETAIGANLSLAFGRAVSVEVRIEHRDRDSDVGLEYKELSGGIFLRYGSARQQGQAGAGL